MKQDINGIIRQIAKQKDITEQEVMDEMKKAMVLGLNAFQGGTHTVSMALHSHF